MFVQTLLIGLLICFCTVQSAEVVMGSVRRPKGISIEEHDQKIRDFWTPERLKGAKSLDTILPKLPQGRTSANHNDSNGPSLTVPGSAPSNNSRLFKAINSYGRQVYTTGKVFFHAPDGEYMCSAAIVTSATADLVATAGHCVYDTDRRVWFNSYWVFIPAYSNGYRPYGTWTARNFLALTSWTNYRDWNYDVAFVALSTLYGWHVQHYLGSQGIGFNFARLQYTYSFGYPGNLDDGNYRKSCIGYAQNPTSAWSSYRGQRLWCNMGGGCSGGPWLQSLNEATGAGYVTAVNSFTLSSAPNYIYGPYFDSTTRFLYDKATIM